MEEAVGEVWRVKRIGSEEAGREEATGLAVAHT